MEQENCVKPMIYDLNNYDLNNKIKEQHGIYRMNNEISVLFLVKEMGNHVMIMALLMEQEEYAGVKWASTWRQDAAIAV